LGTFLLRIFFADALSFCSASQRNGLAGVGEVSKGYPFLCVFLLPITARFVRHGRRFGHSLRIRNFYWTISRVVIHRLPSFPQSIHSFLCQVVSFWLVRRVLGQHENFNKKSDK